MRNRYVLLIDLPLIAIAASAAFTARFDWGFLGRRPEFFTYLLAAVLIKPLVFMLFGMYRRYWQYTTLQDLVLVLTAVSVSSVLMGIFVVAALGRGIDEFSRVVVFNDWLMTFATVGGLRVVIRVLSESPIRGRAAFTSPGPPGSWWLIWTPANWSAKFRIRPAPTASPSFPISALASPPMAARTRPAYLI